jgi:hypothetical protein
MATPKKDPFRNPLPYRGPDAPATPAPATPAPATPAGRRPPPTPAVPSWPHSETVRQGFLFGAGLWLAWLVCSIVAAVLMLLAFAIWIGVARLFNR